MVKTVGIFSRSCEEDYAWLRVPLQECCEVLCVCITNTNRSDVRRSMRQCQFGILYHTRNRGRINITDVTDSLYDDEIRQLSINLGKQNVIAVIDDLEDSSAVAKEAILDRQHALRDLTRDIFLFTALEKRDEAILREKLRPVMAAIPRGTCEIPPHTHQPDNDPHRDNRVRRNFIQYANVVVFTVFVIREAYRSPTPINLVLAGLWTAELSRTFYKKPSKALSSRRLVFKTLGYGLVMYGFYTGWRMQDPTNVWELIIQTALRSPAPFMAVSFLL